MRGMEKEERDRERERDLTLSKTLVCSLAGKAHLRRTRRMRYAIS